MASATITVSNPHTSMYIMSDLTTVFELYEYAVTKPFRAIGIDVSTLISPELWSIDNSGPVKSDSCPLSYCWTNLKLMGQFTLLVAKLNPKVARLTTYT